MVINYGLVPFNHQADRVFAVSEQGTMFVYYYLVFAMLYSEVISIIQVKLKPIYNR